MTNENEKLEIRKKSQQVSEDDLKNVAGGAAPEPCGQSTHKSSDHSDTCSKCL